jgi:hypothetical protein
MNSVQAGALKFSRNPAMGILIRIGDGARAYLSFAIGILALQMALGKISETLDEKGAIAATAAYPLGRFLLLIVLIGLIINVLWALACALFDLLHVGHGVKGLVKRAAFLLGAFAYCLLIPMLIFDISNGSVNIPAMNFNITRLASTIFLLPGGKWLVAIVGATLIVAGLLKLLSGFRRDFDKESLAHSLSPRQVTWVKRVGRFGKIASGTNVVIIGILFMVAFMNADTLKATGIDGALLSLIKLPFGRWLLGFIALGLISSGIYLAVEALWFRTHISKRA